MPAVPRRILVCRIDNLGDVVMLFPALRWLKATQPGLRIEMVVREYARALTQRCPWVDRVWLPEEVARAVEAGEVPPDAVFHLQSTRTLLRDCQRWRIPVRVGNLLRSAHWARCNRWVAFSRRRMQEHDSLLSWRFFGAVFSPGPVVADWPAWLRQEGWLGEMPPSPGGPPAAAAAGAPQPLCVLLHPGSNGNGRQWPATHFAALAQALHDRGHRVLVTGAASEREALAPLLQALPAGVEDHVGQHALPAFITLIGQADCLVASGTGPLHIAGASGRHAVGIFPPLVHIGALRWAPIGPHVSALQTTHTPVPCTRRCSNLECRCMAEVTPEQVLQAVLATPRR